VSAAVTVADNPARHRYEALVDGRVAGFTTYRRRPGRITFVHTEVVPEAAGQGVGGAIARTALDAARAEGLTVVAACPFVAGWIERHPGYADLLAAPAR
jgi:predicted GNAT family acetyltransferase